MSEPTRNEVAAALAELLAAAQQDIDLEQDLNRLNEIQHALSRRLETVDS